MAFPLFSIGDGGMFVLVFVDWSVILLSFPSMIDGGLDEYKYEYNAFEEQLRFRIDTICKTELQSYRNRSEYSTPIRNRDYEHYWDDALLCPMTIYMTLSL